MLSQMIISSQKSGDQLVSYLPNRKMHCCIYSWDFKKNKFGNGLERNDPWFTFYQILPTVGLLQFAIKVI